MTNKGDNLKIIKLEFEHPTEGSLIVDEDAKRIILVIDESQGTSGWFRDVPESHEVEVYSSTIGGMACFVARRNLIGLIVVVDGSVRRRNSLLALISFFRKQGYGGFMVAASDQPENLPEMTAAGCDNACSLQEGEELVLRLLSE